MAYKICKDNGAGKDIKARRSKARAAFAKHQPIWKSSKYSLKTKIHLYNSNVTSVHLYGSECWCIIESDIKKGEIFHNSCLRKINRIFWPNKISNKNLLKKSKCINIVGGIKQRRMRWVESLKLPNTEHHLAREKEADQEQHGGGQLHQS